MSDNEKFYEILVELKTTVARLEQEVKNANSINASSIISCSREKEQKLSALDTRIKSLEDSRSWLSKLVVGAVVSTLLGLVLVGNQVANVIAKIAS